jgi:hypothetical protein
MTWFLEPATQRSNNYLVCKKQTEIDVCCSASHKSPRSAGRKLENLLSEGREEAMDYARRPPTTVGAQEWTRNVTSQLLQALIEIQKTSLALIFLLEVLELPQAGSLHSYHRLWKAVGAPAARPAPLLLPCRRTHGFSTALWSSSPPSIICTPTRTGSTQST